MWGKGRLGCIRGEAKNVTKNYQYHSYSPKMHTFGHKESQQKHRQALPIASGKSRHDVAGVSLVQGTA